MSDKLPATLQLPIKKSALKSLILQHVPAVEFVFTLWEKQDLRQKTRERMKAEGIVNIFECFYWPTGDNSYFSFFSGDGPSVFVRMYGVDRKVWKEKRMQSQYVDELFSKALDKISSVNAWDTNWQTEIQWHPNLFQLEAHSHIDRNGHREERVIHKLLCK